jgi:hypothetical protein
MMDEQAAEGPVRLRIVSDGTPRGTRVEDQDGREVWGVVGVVWSIKVGRFAKASIRLVDVPVVVEGDGEVIP